MDFSKSKIQRMVSEQIRDYIEDNDIGETDDWDAGENFLEDIYQDLVDIQGQVNAEQIGSQQVSMPGGQPAYLRAARRSEGGTSIAL